jgi:membrane protein DedA with SNARE-associated domain
MPARRFLAADVVGAGLWALTFTGLGYLFAEHVGALVEALHRAQLGLEAVVALVAFVVVRRRRRVGT